MKDPEFIVAEITVSWKAGQPAARLISERFADVISHNLDRGYVLYSFAHSQVLFGASEQQETIVAVFRKDLTKG